MGRGWAAETEAIEQIDPAWISERLHVASTAQLLDVVEVFRAAPHRRMVAVVDATRRPIGAVHECDVRQLLFSPFGYALLSNRSLAIGIGKHLRRCPIVPLAGGIALALAEWRQAPAAEGLIVTQDDRFVGTIDQPTLLRIAAERDIAANRRESARAQAIERSSRTFEAQARALATDLSQASHSVAGMAGRMAVRAQEIGAHTAAVAAATTQAASNLAEVSERAHAFAGALGAVETSTNAARDATGAAVARSRIGARQIDGLVDAADAIGSVTALIDDIAQRTTMLALNATIEAARGTEATRGFAVVAAEVKALATQTRTAAADISTEIVRVRGAIADVRAAQGDLSGAVEVIDGQSGTVAGAIGEQSRAGRQISMHVAEASMATDHVRANIDDILHGARAASDDAETMSALAGSLAKRADELERQVVTFLDALAS